MKRLTNIFKRNSIILISIAVLGVLSLLSLNIFALFEYIKYAFSISNRFIAILPAIKVLLNVDFLFIFTLLFVYNTAEKVIPFNTMLILLTILGFSLKTSNLIKDKSAVIILLLGIYSTVMILFSAIIGFGLIVNIISKDVNKRTPTLKLSK